MSNRQNDYQLKHMGHQICFDTPAEEENIMEWIHIESPRYERIDKSDLPKKGEVEEMKNRIN